MNDYMMFDVAAVLIFLTLIVSNVSKNRVKGRTISLYLAELIISSITIIFRLTYQIILRQCAYSATTVTVAKIFVYLALISRSFVYPVGLLFVFSLIGLLPLFYRNDTMKVFLILLFNVPVLYILMDCIKHILFEITTDMQLVMLPPVIVLNMCILLVIVFGFGVIVYYRKIIERIHVILGTILIPLIGILFGVQIFFPQAQIEMFVIAITCYLVFATIQRPELLINPQTLAQSNYSFESELKKAINITSAVKIIFIKITNFKSINMYVGNEKFYDQLKKITLYMRGICRRHKLNSGVYYLDDYVYALPTEGQSDEMIYHEMNDLEKYFSQVFLIDGIKVNLETRICVVRYPDDISNFEYLTYIAKTFHNIIEPNGHPQWYRDYAGDRDFIIKNNIVKIIDRAINENNFEVYYQPIYDIKKKKFLTAEALVRLNDPEYGNIPPGLFIKYAEISNKIHIIGDFVIERVCEFMGSGQGKSLGIEHIEVNLSVAQCVETELVEKIRNWLEEYNVSPNQLRLEITENAATFNPQIVEKNILKLKEMGINFALDDYGIGYSNIKKVISLPFDVVKLNKTFVDEIDNPNTESLVKDTIHMLKALGKKVLIEGVETESRADTLMNFRCDKTHGCDYLQGFYFSKPLPETEFVKFLTM